MGSRSEPPDELDLCDVCRQVDYDKALTASVARCATIEEMDNYPGVVVASLGRRPADLGACKVCRLLWHYAWWPRYRNALELPPDTTWELRAFPVNRISFHFPQMNQGMVQDRGICLVPVPENTAVRAWDVSVPFNGVLVCTRTLHAEDPLTRKSRLIPWTYSPEVVKGWLGICKEAHGEHCSRGLPLEDFRLIDCATLTVVDATDATPWVALSYLWRIALDTHENPATYPEDLPASRRLPPLVPGVVMDAIKVAKSLGYGYLWVDRYCIDKTDLPQVERQIGLMDRIFRGADLTIVAASQHNGLPGVGSTPRTPQTILELPDGTTLFTMPDYKADILRSEWSSRGWTYQEQILSRRRLTFTDHEMAYECDGALTCWESVTDPITKTAREDLEFSLTYRAHGDPLQWTLYQYHNFASEFSRRKLTYEKDTLDAFRGIMNTFIPGRSFEWLANPDKVPLYPFYGLPSVTPELRGFTEEQAKVLTFGLSWFHHTTMRSRYGTRRPGYPSWSWAGWRGPFVLQNEHANFHPYSRIEELLEPIDRAGEDQGTRLPGPAVRMRAVVVPDALLAPTFTAEEWGADVKFLGFTHYYREDEQDPVPHSPRELAELVRGGDRVCVLLGGEKEWSQIDADGVATWASFSVYILVLGPVPGMEGESGGLPVMERVGMVLFEHDIPAEGAKWEEIEAFTGLDLGQFSTQEMLIV